MLSSKRFIAAKIGFLTPRETVVTPSRHPFLAIACRISGLSPEIGPETLYEAMCHTVGTGAILVVEDVPELSGDDELSVRLLCLARICQACGVSLLSTTWYGMPIKISEACGHTMLSVLEPELSNEEAEELLAAYGAPEYLLKTGPEWL